MSLKTLESHQRKTEIFFYTLFSQVHIYITYLVFNVVSVSVLHSVSRLWLMVNHNKVSEILVISVVNKS